MYELHALERRLAEAELELARTTALYEVTGAKSDYADMMSAEALVNELEEGIDELSEQADEQAWSFEFAYAS